MLKLDHVVVKVPALESAIAAYEQAGFTVTRGGAHPAFGSVNALIPFHDDSYLELIAFPGAMSPDATSSPPGQRVAEWAHRPPGAVDWALVPDDIEAEIARLRAAGQQWHDPIPGQRFRPDDTTVRWLFGTPEQFVYPFLCADVTARELRVPPGAARDHANGAAGISELTVAARDIEKTTCAFESIMGSRAEPTNTPQELRLTLARWQVRLVSLETVGARNEGLCAVRLAGWDGALPAL